MGQYGEVEVEAVVRDDRASSLDGLHDPARRTVDHLGGAGGGDERLVGPVEAQPGGFKVEYQRG
ncbi:MAG: hypothetical protein V9G09_13230 [Candidatus Nanopelagicales bacterium]